MSLPLADNQARQWIVRIPGWSSDEHGSGREQPLLTRHLLFDFTAPCFFTGAALGMTWKIEYRLDGAIGNVFLCPDGSYRKRNELVGTYITVAF